MSEPTGARRNAPKRKAQPAPKRPDDQAEARRTDRWGLVLGGGGVLGAAWMVGALSALQEVHGLDPRDADVIIGTSAGSVLTALIGAGASVPELRANNLGEPVATGPLAGLNFDHDHATGGSTPPIPKLSLKPQGATMMTQYVSRLRHLPPTAVLAALLPMGRGSLASIGALVSAVQPGGWSAHPGVRTVAMDLDTGRRTAFGSPDAPPADLADAVMASCAIPGWYAPVTIDGHRYVDGGACSATNIDLMIGEELDRVFVLAPMVSFAMDSPSHWRSRMERSWRARVTRRSLHEVTKLHATGTEVTVIGPGPQDLEAIGSNLMAVDRRRSVLETSLRTSAIALADPESLADARAKSASDEHAPRMPDNGSVIDLDGAGEAHPPMADAG